MRFLQALQFLTILRFSRAAEKDFQPGTLALCAPYFPLVGLLIGLASYTIFLGMAPYLRGRPGALALLFGPVVLSGGLHLDGLSDFCDGFFSPKSSRWEILKIMKDPHVGVMGVTGIVSVMLVKFEVLSLISAQPWVFFFSLAAARMMQVALAFFLSYAGDEMGIGRGFIGRIPKKGFITALVLTSVSGLPLGIPFLAVCGISLALWGVCLAALVKRRLGGATGDVLGAASEISEVIVLGAGMFAFQ